MDVSVSDGDHILLTTDDEDTGADASNVDSAPESYEAEAETGRRLHRRRLATLYDTVAGKVSKERPLTDEDGGGGDVSENRPNVTRHSTRATPITPDEVLFRRKDAPVRYHERDIYRAHERDLPRAGQGVLPDSDLLKSVHLYAARFYGAMNHRSNEQNELDNKSGRRGRMPRIGGGRNNVDERSLDETGLLAFGILLEEAGREVLGRKGDLVLTEGRTDEGEGVELPQESPLGDEVASERETAVAYREAGSSAKHPDRTPKRRRVEGQERVRAPDE